MLYHIWQLQPLVCFSSEAEVPKSPSQFEIVSLSTSIGLGVTTEFAIGLSHNLSEPLFQGDVVGIGPRFPSKIRFIQCYLSITKTDFLKLCVSSFSGPTKDSEAKL